MDMLGTLNTKEIKDLKQIRINKEQIHQDLIKNTVKIDTNNEILSHIGTADINEMLAGLTDGTVTSGAGTQAKGEMTLNREVRSKHSPEGKNMSNSKDEVRGFKERLVKLEGCMSSVSKEND